MRRKPIAAALATLALALGMAIGAPAQQASALTQWTPWLTCYYGTGQGWNPRTDYQLQIVWSGASGGPGAVTAIRFGNGNAESINQAEFWNIQGGVPVGVHPLWHINPAQQTWLSPFTGQPYFPAGNHRAAIVKLWRNGQGVFKDNYCQATATY